MDDTTEHADQLNLMFANHGREEEIEIAEATKIDDAIMAILSRSINYINLDTSEWPTFSINVDSQGFLFDINRSGTVDLIMYPLKADVSANIEIYTSNRNITD